MKQTFRNEETKKNYLIHLNKIKGQIEGISNQIRNDSYCLDIINQINAIKGSLHSISKKLLNDHISACVYHSHDLSESLNEIQILLDKVMK